jgi:hypothetical protein
MQALRIDPIPSDEEIASFYHACAAQGPYQPGMYQHRPQQDRLKRIKRLLSGMLPLCDGVLEAGCCDGLLSEWIASRCDHLVGVDIAQPCVERCFDLGIVNARFLVGTIFGRTVAWGGPYELAVATEVLEHVRDPKAHLVRMGQLARVVLASVPIRERPNPDAFSVEGFSNPKKPGDGTGHIWCFRPDTFRALFDEVFWYEDNGYSAIVVGR